MTASIRPVRTGIIGCGNVLSAYAPALEKLRVRGAVEVIVACGRESQRASALDQTSARRFTADADEVTTAPDVDLVLILTSANNHAPLARAALEGGKHVLVEKPLAVTMEDANALVELPTRCDRHLCCAPFTLLSPTFQTMARRLRCGDIGRPCLARARYGWAGPDWTEWFYKPGGGCLFDLAVYSLTSLTGLLGPAKRVMAMTGVAIEERDIGGRRIRVEAEDNAQVLLDFGQNVFGSVTSGFTMQQYRSPALEVYGTTGTMQMMGDDWDPDGYELWQNDAGAWQIFSETAPDWPWTDGLNHLIDCIQTDKQPIVTPEHARHVLEIMVKAQQSGREGRAWQIDSRFAPPDFPDAKAGEAVHLIHDRTRSH